MRMHAWGLKDKKTGALRMSTMNDNYPVLYYFRRLARLWKLPSETPVKILFSVDK